MFSFEWDGRGREGRGGEGFTKTQYPKFVNSHKLIHHCLWQKTFSINLNFCYGCTFWSHPKSLNVHGIMMLGQSPSITSVCLLICKGKEKL